MKITIFHLGGWKAQGLPKGVFGHVAFAIKEAVPFSMFAKPAFRKLFTVVNKNASQIVNIGPERVRDQVMKFGLIAERATQLDLNGVKIAWTTDHWTSPNDQSFTTLTAHYIDNIWQMRSACLDFKVFHGTTTGDKIYEDVKSVLARYKSETIMLVEDKIVDTIVDTIGIAKPKYYLCSRCKGCFIFMSV
jgi:hypothetical protein